MLKVLHSVPQLKGPDYIEGDILSTDEKPNAAVMSLLLELDTKTLYYCSKSGGESEEVVYEGEVANEGNFQATKLLSNTITVIYDGTEYTAQKFYYDGKEFWGASFDSQGNEDYSKYPFQISVYEGFESDGYDVIFEDGGTHSLSISSVVTTEAEWTVYGEQGSGSSGEMINVYFANNSGATLYNEYTTQMAKDGEITMPNYISSRASGWDLFPNGTQPTKPYYTAGETFTILDEGIICTEKPSYFESLDLTAPFILFLERTDGLG